MQEGNKFVVHWLLQICCAEIEKIKA